MDASTVQKCENQEENLELSELQSKTKLLKELDEKNNIIQGLKKQVAATNLNVKNISKLYKKTKQKLATERIRLKRLQNFHLKSLEAVSTRLRSDQIGL